MPKLHLKVIKPKTKMYSPKTDSFLNNASRFVQEKIHRMLDNDVLPLIIAPSIFLIFAGLEWWRWYLEIPTPIPLLLTIIALSLGVYCSHKLLGYKRNENRQKNLRTSINQHPELH